MVRSPRKANTFKGVVSKMGYTHYWYRRPLLDAEGFACVISDFKRIMPRLAEYDVRLGDGLGRGEPILTDDEAIFNGLENCGHPENHEIVIPWPSYDAGGVGSSSDALSGNWFAGGLIDKRCCNGDCSYETFAFQREYNPQDWEFSEEGKYFDFCKTAFRPYDLAVTAFLIIAKHHLQDDITIRSDGEDVHWFDAKLLCQMELGYGQSFSLAGEVKS